MVDGSVPEHASYTGWVSIPYLTRLAGVVKLKFRRTDGESHGKYMGSGEHRLYNTICLDRAEQLGYAAICEGEIDAITLDALCGIPAVAVPGATTWAGRPEWAEMFRGFQRVLVFADQDEEGEKLAAKIRADLDTARIVSLSGKDVNETFLSHGAETIREAAGV